MKNASTRKLFAYWNERRGSRLAPERDEIEPGAIRDVLADSFIISFDRDADHPFRLAGTKVCALFGRELKGAPFCQLWDQPSGKVMREIVSIIADEAVGLVAGATGRTADGLAAELELLLLPLYHRGNMHVRLLGALAPVAVPYWIGSSQVDSLALGALRHLGPALETIAAPRLVSGSRGVDVRRGLTVYDGGRPAERRPPKLSLDY